jgi:hypothetical protein
LVLERYGEGELPVMEERMWVLAKIGFDAKRTSKFGKKIKEEGEVSIRESDGSIIYDRGSVRLRAKEIIIGLLVVEETELRAFKEECIDLFE